MACQLPEEQGGASGKVAYIDTESVPPFSRPPELTNVRGTFRPDRIRAIADRFGVDGQMALENILCARVWSSEQQCEMLVELAIRSVSFLWLRWVTHAESFVEDRTYKLVIVDSVMNLFREHQRPDLRK